MFDQLNLSPMMMLLLLLYGLLIAVILVLWTALDLGKRRQPQERAAEQPAQPDRRTPAVQQEHKEATPPPDARVARRTADSDSVVSYSVRPRVTHEQQRPAPTEQAALPPAEPRPAETERRREPIPTAEVDFPTGRESRKPRAEKPATITPVRQPAPGSEQPGNPQRSRSEDAFERFLRSSGNDNDDY